MFFNLFRISDLSIQLDRACQRHAARASRESGQKHVLCGLAIYQHFAMTAATSAAAAAAADTTTSATGKRMDWDREMRVKSGGKSGWY